MYDICPVCGRFFASMHTRCVTRRLPAYQPPDPLSREQVVSIKARADALTVDPEQPLTITTKPSRVQPVKHLDHPGLKRRLHVSDEEDVPLPKRIDSIIEVSGDANAGRPKLRTHVGMAEAGRNLIDLKGSDNSRVRFRGDNYCHYSYIPCTARSDDSSAKKARPPDNQASHLSGSSIDDRKARRARNVVRRDQKEKRAAGKRREFNSFKRANHIFRRLKQQRTATTAVLRWSSES